MSPSDQLPPRRRGTSCLGKVSRKTASRHMNECTRFRCPICTVIIVGTEYRVERTRAGDSLRRDDPSRARRATTTPRQETHDSSGGGDGSGDDGHVFSLSQNSIWGGGGSQGVPGKNGERDGQLDRPAGPKGWLAGWEVVARTRSVATVRTNALLTTTTRIPPFGSRKQTPLEDGIQDEHVSGRSIQGSETAEQRPRRLMSGMMLSAMWTGLGTFCRVGCLFRSATKHPQNRGDAAARMSPVSSSKKLRTKVSAETLGSKTDASPCRFSAPPSSRPAAAQPVGSWRRKRAKRASVSIES